VIRIRPISQDRPPRASPDAADGGCCSRPRPGTAPLPLTAA